MQTICACAEVTKHPLLAIMAASMGTGEGSLGHPIRSGQASAKKRVGDWVATLLQPKKNRQSYSLHRDFQALERDQRVTTILNSGAFRSELEGILQGQLEGRRQPQQPSKAIQQLQENVVPPPPGPGPRIVGAGLAAKAVIPINDLRGVRASKYAMFERQKRCKLAAVYRLADMFGWGALILNHFSVSTYIAGLSRINIPTVCITIIYYKTAEYPPCQYL